MIKGESIVEVRNKKLSDEEFERERKEVLGMWPTGIDMLSEKLPDFKDTFIGQ